MQFFLDFFSDCFFYLWVVHLNLFGKFSYLCREFHIIFLTIVVFIASNKLSREPFWGSINISQNLITFLLTTSLYIKIER